MDTLFPADARLRALATALRSSGDPLAALREYADNGGRLDADTRRAAFGSGPGTPLTRDAALYAGFARQVREHGPVSPDAIGGTPWVLAHRLRQAGDPTATAMVTAGQELRVPDSDDPALTDLGVAMEAALVRRGRRPDGSLADDPPAEEIAAVYNAVALVPSAVAHGIMAAYAADARLTRIANAARYPGRPLMRPADAQEENAGPAMEPSGRADSGPSIAGPALIPAQPQSIQLLMAATARIACGMVSSGLPLRQPLRDGLVDTDGDGTADAYDTDSPQWLIRTIDTALAGAEAAAAARPRRTSGPASGPQRQDAPEEDGPSLG